ncbi:TPA: AAA family ATPase [Candidatus Woesearchaeota archaeon]|nr:AAA family ATPase [Candidatus Woesearchaeota archaeon]
MGLFDDVLQSGQSLVRSEEALDYEFLPKVLPFREKEQRYLAECIRPLFQARSGRNVLIHGMPGIGKTAATRAVLRDLEESSDEVHVVYLNCWRHNSTFKILVEICDQLGYKFTQNKNTTELMKVIASICNKKSVVFAFDEVDKVEDFDFLYPLLEDIYKKTVILITNYKSWLMELDERIRSRLQPELLEFKQYSASEVREILKQRVSFAFVPGVLEDAAFEAAAKKAGDVKDVRAGLFLLKNASLEAESKASKKILLVHVQTALARMDEFFTKNKEDLEDDTQNVLALVNKSPGKKIGELFLIYQKAGGQGSYKTFQRKIARLEQNRFISVEKSGGGAAGNTTIVHKRIDEY